MFSYCNDVVCIDAEFGTPARWYARSGTVEIDMTQPVQQGIFSTYYVTVRLTDVVFSNGLNDSLRVESLDLDSVYVGWLPG